MNNKMTIIFSCIFPSTTEWVLYNAKDPIVYCILTPRSPRPGCSSRSHLLSSVSPSLSATAPWRQNQLQYQVYRIAIMICSLRIRSLHYYSVKQIWMQNYRVFLWTVTNKFGLRAIKMIQIKFKPCACFSPLQVILSGGIKIDFSFKIEWVRAIWKSGSKWPIYVQNWIFWKETPFKIQFYCQNKTYSQHLF